MSMNYQIKLSKANLLVFLVAAFSVCCIDDSNAGQGTSNIKLFLGNKTNVEKQPEKNETIIVGDFKAAARQNAELKNSLQWVFGKKNQTGWYLYVPLIQHTIKTSENSDSENFAGAVAAWQKQKGLSATGVIDQNTLLALVKFWQSRRLGKSADAPENTLLTAPADDFYDSSREEINRKVEREAYAAYKKMAAAAVKELKLKSENGNLAKDERFLKIISAYRSREYQEGLRRKEPNAGRAGLGVNSPHFTGGALDIYVGGEPVTTKDENRAIQVQTPVYKWLVKNAERFGFYPYFYEPCHWEYVP